MITTYDLTLMIYNLALIPMIFFSVMFLLLSLINVFISKKKERYPELKELPFISVQIPTFNDPIAARCVRKCMEFNYPKDKYEIIIVDDSTNIQTQLLLKGFEKEGFIRYIHRKNRQGFKPGALKNAMKITRGEIIVVFDSDWIPGRNFLRKIIRPFADPDVAIVQSRQGFYNHKTNLITRFAAYTLMMYHTIVMPINNSINCVFFCGTAGALRRKYFDEVGGWNTASITEDSELSMKLLLRGYRSVYLDFETPSEVPDTFEGLVKQQMRWCYGNVRVFIDNISSVLIKRGLSIRQRIMIMYFTLGNIIAPVVIVMTIFGLSGWFLGEPSLFQFSDILDFFTRFLFTSGFILMGIITLHKNRMLGEFKDLVISTFLVGPVVAVGNSVAFFKAVFNKSLHWTCTWKIDNLQVKIK